MKTSVFSFAIVLITMIAVIPQALAQSILQYGEGWGSHGRAKLRGDVVAVSRPYGYAYGIRKSSKPEMSWGPDKQSITVKNCTGLAGEGSFVVKINREILFYMEHMDQKFAPKNLKSNDSYTMLPGYELTSILPNISYSFWKPKNSKNALSFLTVSAINFDDGQSFPFLKAESFKNGIILKWGGMKESKTSVSVFFPVWEALIQPRFEDRASCF